MDILIEVIGELLSAVFEGVTESKRIPKPVRVAVTLMLFIPLTGLCIALAVLMEGIVVRVIFSLLALFFVFGAFKLVRGIITGRRR